MSVLCLLLSIAALLAPLLTLLWLERMSGVKV